jgi:hypothetical protein
VSLNIVIISDQEKKSNGSSMLVEPQKFSTLCHLVAMPEIMENHSARISFMAANSVDTSDDEKKKKAEEMMKQLGYAQT